MKSSLLEKYLYKAPELTLIQAKVDKELHRQAKNYINKNDLTWNELITACLKWLIDQDSPPRKSS